MNGMYKIEKGVPLPAKTKARFPLLDMKKGDSFLIRKKDRGNLTGMICYHKSRYKLTYQFVSRTVGANVRVWRVK